MGASSRPRVILIDDEMAIGRIFTVHSHFSKVWDVVHEPKPKLALERLCRDDELFDVIFLDIIMPELNGIMLFDDLGEHAPARQLRVVFLTGGGLIPAVAEFLDTHHHVEKPFSIEEIEAIVKVYSELDVSRGPR
jgi:DNA-binding response OmpR family regulator